MPFILLSLYSREGVCCRIIIGLHAILSTVLSIVKDDQYSIAGASLVSASQAFSQNLVLKIRPPTTAEEVPMLNEHSQYVQNWSMLHLYISW